MEARAASERGSAMVEAAIVFPCLVLILYWSAALTDVMVLKLKAAEAVRYALWETTVFKPPARIRIEVQEKFVDLRSPRAVRSSATGLLMFPLAKDLSWSASVDSASERVGIGGSLRLPSGTGLGRWLRMLGTLSAAVDDQMRNGRFNVHGRATVRVSLDRATHDRASPLLQGGDLPGLRGGKDLGSPRSLSDFRFQAPLLSQRPMQLVFDTWKAWPKPATCSFAGAPTDTAVSPGKTYPVVEEQVSAQVGHLAFLGLASQPWFTRLRDVGNTLLRFLGPVAGGDLPDVFSSGRMDLPGRKRGPITILPPQLPTESWVPRACEVRGRTETCATQRLGDLRVSGPSPAFLDDTATLGSSVDRTRYTLPFAINTEYWTQGGGTNDGDKTGQARRMAAPPATIARGNDYVNTYNCRGHFFAGSQRGQEPDANRRYGRSCYR